MHKFRKNISILTLISFLIISILTACTNNTTHTQEPISDTAEKPQANFLTVHFLDVGQADSIFVQLPNNETLLIDGGNRDDGEDIVSYISNLGIERIDYIIATHPHEDHIGGLPDVIRTFDIGEIYMPKQPSNTVIFETLLTEISNKGLKVNSAFGHINIIDNGDLALEILAPNSEDYEETNEYSVVNKLTYGNTSFLFTGDGEKITENEMIELKYDLSADVLKVGHHGGRTSTSKEFLRKVQPTYGIISVGKDNEYGHPHQEVLDRLDSNNVNVLRTDEAGTIVVTSDGKNISFNDEINFSSEINNTNTDNDKNYIYYIGNRNTKVYHENTCNSLPNKENQIVLNSRVEAENEGFKPHKTCVE